MHPMLNTAVRAARQAGRIINRASLDLDTLAVARKQRNDFVTEVDRASEEAIIEVLRTAYPNHSILAEESGHDPKGPAGHPREAEHIWIIDPLDGTTNFIHGFRNTPCPSRSCRKVWSPRQWYTTRREMSSSPHRAVAVPISMAGESGSRNASGLKNL